FASQRRYFTAAKYDKPQSSCIYTSTAYFEEFQMFLSVDRESFPNSLIPCKRLISCATVVFLTIAVTTLVTAQDTSQQPPPPATQSQGNPNKQDTPPEAGGPQTDVGPYAIPKKKEEPP